MTKIISALAEIIEKRVFFCQVGGMKQIRYHNIQVASILFIVFSITLFPGCTYKYHSFGYEKDKIQTLESGDQVSVLMKNYDTYKLQIIEVDQFALRGTDKQKQMVELPLSEIDVVQKLKADKKTLIIAGVTIAAAIAVTVTLINNPPCYFGSCP
jgi:hypothetical protein